MEGPHTARLLRHRLALPRQRSRKSRSRDDRERNAGPARTDLIAERPRHVPHRLRPDHGSGAVVSLNLTLLPIRLEIAEPLFKPRFDARFRIRVEERFAGR